MFIKMFFNSWVLSLVGYYLLVNVEVTRSVLNKNEGTETTSDFCDFLVIAHRGASGYVPEHTLRAYALAVTMGADYIEPDLVSTVDGHLISRHDNELSLTTDIARRPEFATRRRTKTVDGKNMTGWFTEDFTLAEIKTLRVIERLPNLRPANAQMDGTLTIATFSEILDLVKTLQVTHKRIIGIYPEIKHSTHFQRLGLPMEQKVVNTFRDYGYWRSTDPVYIQSFEVINLRELKNSTELKLMQLIKRFKGLRPFDQDIIGNNLTFGHMATLEGLKEIARYASAVGPDKAYIIPRDEHNNLGTPTSFVADAHSLGLEVHPYTFSAENFFLPADFQTDQTPSVIGDLSGEIKAYLATGIDGLFCEQPDLCVNLRSKC